ncbi:MAG TPA: glutamate--tRNA ligase [Patescibacteria group bacterium]|nr:glutamate--tRNA ligase [Patescibacteria group bacterium]
MEKINTGKVRVRIAPSPTGYVHVGNLRTILYTYLFAKRHDGQFIIRVEDTDQNRIVPGAVEDLLEVLQWAGIEGDEGPRLTKDRKIKQTGEFGPYYQSKRLDIYHDYIQQLLDKNKAYPCFCTKERLDKLREKQRQEKKPPKYDGFCRNLSKKEAQAMMDSGAPYVIRFKMPENKNIVFEDLIRGKIVVNTKDMDDFVLIKSDGYPTYHFANIIDDHLMKISHVMRGDEWIASTPKHIMLYEAFDWQPPIFAHLPTLLNKQKKKLSKRDGGASVRDFIDQGYLSQAFINFIALLGWNAGTEQEIYTLGELEKQFSLDNIHTSGAVFDLDKLNWINGIYIRKMTEEEFFKATMPFLAKAGLAKEKDSQVKIIKTGEVVKPSYIKKILGLEQTRIKRLEEISEATEYFFMDKLEYEPKKLIWKKSDQKTTIDCLNKMIRFLDNMSEQEFNLKKLKIAVFDFIEKNSWDNGTALWPMRYALSGRDRSPDPFELADALGKEKTLNRLKTALKKLQ